MSLINLKNQEIRPCDLNLVSNGRSIYMYVCVCVCVCIQSVSLVDITAGGDFLGLCDQKSSYKHVSDFGRLRSYGYFLIPVHVLV